MPRMKPFFPYFGSKYRLAKRYGAPADICIEPFAGSACYSTWHEFEVAHLFDLDENISKVWGFLLSATQDDVARLPDLPNEGDSPFGIGLPEGAAELIGFWLNKGVAPAKKRGAYAASEKWRGQFWRPQVRDRIAEQLPKIANWTFHKRDFSESADIASSETVTFIDPPYIQQGHHYKHKFFDYSGLAQWSADLPGSVIVCEGAGAEWMPFRSLGDVKSFTSGVSEEKVWAKNA